MAVTKVVMPKLSDAMESGKIIKWLKKEGDRIQGGDILAEVETDKADVEMEAFGAGVLRKILVPAGDTAPIGTLIGVIAEPGEDITALVSSAAGLGRCAGLRRGWRRSRAGHEPWRGFRAGACGSCRRSGPGCGGCRRAVSARWGAGEGFAVG
jgi:pyruvate/2-oxoglutarate dehydrogenase complex dihydrolipoamide acyltransferase (E2) component